MNEKCPNKSICGSCDFSDLPYQKQLEKKLLNINILLSENGLISKEIIPSPKISHYRNKMDYTIDFQRKVGLREKGKWWKVIDGHTCFLADERIENIFFKTRDWVKGTLLSCWDRKTYQGFLRYAVVRATTKNETMLTIVTSPPENEEEKQLALNEFEELNRTLKTTTFVWSVNNTNSDISFGTDLKILDGLGYITEEINELKYRISPNSFFQTNSHTAAILQNKVIEMAKKNNPRTALDLYCGSGFFSLALAKAGINIKGIEVVDEAIADAKINAQINNLSISFLSEVAEKLSWKDEEFDLILVDPTRAGLNPKVIETILEVKPKSLIYVSCNYKQFNAELPKFLTQYKVEDCIAIDQFPQTNHVELLTSFTLR